jgi:hypothetical protein
MAERTLIDIDELREVWWVLSVEERLDGFRLLETEEAEEFFADLPPRDQAELLSYLLPAERRLLLRSLAPDDAVDLIQEVEEGDRPVLLRLLDERTQREVSVLMAYEEDEAGGLMSSRFARVRPDMTVDQAISYLRKQAVAGVELETIYYSYVLEADHRLVGIVSFRELFAQPGSRPGTRRHAHRLRGGPRGDGPGRRRTSLRRVRRPRPPRRGRAGPHEGHRHGGRHRGRRRRGSHRGRPQVRRPRRAGRAVPAHRLPGHREASAPAG